MCDLAARRIQEFWIQSKQRKFIIRDREFDKFKSRVILIQAHWRGYSARIRYDIYYR